MPSCLSLVSIQQYNASTTTEAEELLKTQKAETPARIPYLMCRRGVPGYLTLMYIPNSRYDDDDEEYIHGAPCRSQLRRVSAQHPVAQKERICLEYCMMV